MFDPARAIDKARGIFGRLGQGAADGYREAVPAHYRLLLSSMLGDRSPITEGNLSPREIEKLRQIVAQDQARLPQRAADNKTLEPVWAQLATQKAANLAKAKALGRDLTDEEAFKLGIGVRMHEKVPLARAVAELSDDVNTYRAKATTADNVARRASHGVGAITYDAADLMALDTAGGYPISPERRMHNAMTGGQIHLGPITMGVDYGDRDVNAVANTLGQFVYKPASDGGTQIDDTYAWKAFNDANYGGKPPPLPDALMQLLHGNAEPLIARAMPDYGRGRPVHVHLPPGRK